MPGGNGFRGAPVNLSQGRGPVNPQQFFLPVRTPPRFVIVGKTYDSTGVALGNADVFVLQMPSKILVAESRSDANGNYLADGQFATTYWVLWYKSGTPDLAGCSVNTVVAVPA